MATPYPRPAGYLPDSSTPSAPRRRSAAHRAIDWLWLVPVLLFVTVAALELTVVLRAGLPLDGGGDLSSFP
jgi:hypothetical protein